jgi:hypothetical protein
MEKFKLIKEILNLSYSNVWAIARNEWELEEIYFSDFPETCLCGHFPIKELCVLRNKINSNEITVGNCCVKKFIEPESDKIFRSVKRIIKDNGKSFNRETIDYAFKNNRINEWEYIFYSDTLMKRNLSPKQIEKRKLINEKILLWVNYLRL